MDSPDIKITPQSAAWLRAQEELLSMSNQANYYYPVTSLLKLLGVTTNIGRLIENQNKHIPHSNIIVVNNGLDDPLIRWSWHEDDLHLYLSLAEALNNMTLTDLSNLLSREGISFDGRVTGLNKEEAIDQYISAQNNDIRRTPEINIPDMEITVPDPMGL